jgi:TrmH family RNA methyltransferase
MTLQKDELLTSIHNPLIQLTRTLLRERSARSENGLFIAEGIRLADEVMKSSILPRFILHANNLSNEGSELLNYFRTQDVRIINVPPDLMDRISATETSQGILMALPLLTSLLPDSSDLVLILDQLRDPGNMGTILRSAAAAGVKSIFLTPGCVDPFMPKVVRSAMGAHFRLSIHIADWVAIESYCLEQCKPPLEVLIADSGSGISCWETNLKTPIALVIGSEAEGPGNEAHRIAKGTIHIPMPGNFESLNAGVAASILLFEIIRQRQK